MGSSRECRLLDDTKLADAGGRELAVIKQNYLPACRETCLASSDLKVLLIRYLFLRTFFYESHLTNERGLADSLTPGQKFHCTTTLCQVQSCLRFVLGY